MDPDELPRSMPTTWEDRAECRGMETATFFSDEPVAVATAKAACARCEVQRECITAAMRPPGQSGTWGGMTEAERPRARKASTAPLKRCQWCSDQYTPTRRAQLFCADRCQRSAARARRKEST